MKEVQLKSTKGKISTISSLTEYQKNSQEQKQIFMGNVDIFSEFGKSIKIRHTIFLCIIQILSCLLQNRNLGIFSYYGMNSI